MNFLAKIKFLFKKPKVIIVTGNGRKTAREAIFQVLKQHFKVGLHLPTTFPVLGAPEILIFETELKEEKELEFLIKKSALPILVITRVGDIPADKDFFAGDKKDTIQSRKLAKILPAQGYLILNFDDETVREIRGETNLKEITHAPEGHRPSVRGFAPRSFTFGFQEGADFRASDIKLNSGTNFKINYKGNIVPIWLEKLFGKEQIYSALAAAVVGTVLELNLVEISNALKDYNPY